MKTSPSNKPSRQQRGISIIEVMMAAVLLALGVTAMFAMLDRVEGANRSLDFARTANDAYARLAAEIRDAQCDYDGRQVPPVMDGTTTDPGLAAVIGVGWVGVDVVIPVGSSITQAGVSDGSNPFISATVPTLRIEYRLVNEAPVVVAPGAIRGAPAGVGPAFDVEIRIRKVTGNPAMDDPTVNNGWWIKHFPVKKVCNPRYESRRRGEYL